MRSVDRQARHLARAGRVAADHVPAGSVPWFGDQLALSVTSDTFDAQGHIADAGIRWRLEIVHQGVHRFRRGAPPVRNGKPLPLCGFRVPLQLASVAGPGIVDLSTGARAASIFDRRTDQL